ncbi:MAG: S1 RNA-binding domain-containing protein [Bacilli bacterium]|jgi:predicted RNA-binding protein with RPS1 domain|nr:S1 RNA-binding domain-containing protein [Bacilli bacterium]
MAVEFKVGDIIEGTVIELRKFGALMIFEHDVNGLLHISEISDRFVFDISRYIQVGRNYNVKILEIDSNNHFMKVSLRKVTIEDRLDHKAQTRKRSIIDEEYIDFSPLKEQLDQWTKEQVNQTKEAEEDVES